jgi:putative membrane protein
MVAMAGWLRQIVDGWSLQPVVSGAIAIAAVLYVHGVRTVTLRRGRWSAWRTASFLAGLATVAVALVSPLESASHRLLSAHMVQHMLLMQAAPPLILLGRPMTLLLASSSRPVRRRAASLVRGRFAHAVASPALGFASLVLVLYASHLSPLYEATLTNPLLHAMEHGLFLGAALLFWWPVVARDPGAARLSHPSRLLYLFLSMPVMSILGLVISSANRVLYPYYLFAARPGGIGHALADQRLAGTIMWEGSMLVAVVALSAVLLDWMRREDREALRQDALRDRARSGARGGTAAEIV